MKLIFAVLMLAQGLWAAVISVGPGKQFERPCEAIKAAKSGDVIEIDAAGTYADDHDSCVIMTGGLTIRGVKGRPHLVAPRYMAEAKAVFVVRAENTTIENLEISGAFNTSRNGAAIRDEEKNLTLRHVFFHDCQNGVLTARDGLGDILIEDSEFANNGEGDGYSHNLYINHAEKFTLRSSYSHDAKVGHLVKSRARVNYILNNHPSDGPQGTASYEIELPNGGTTYVIGNLIEKSATGSNNVMLSFRAEAGNPRQAEFMFPNDDLHVVNNTFISRQTELHNPHNPNSPAKPAPTKFIFIDPSTKAPAVIQNNIFQAVQVKFVTNQESAILKSNILPDKNAKLGAHFELLEASPAIGAATPVEKEVESLRRANIHDIGAFAKEKK